MESPIEMLNEDDLMEVLKFLDQYDQREFALVCKNWNKLVVKALNYRLCLENTHWHINGQYSKLPISWSSDMEAIMSMRRNFRAITVYLLKDSLELIPRVAAQHGSRIKVLNLFTSESDIFKYLSSIFENMLMLETLVMNVYQHWRDHDVQSSAATQVELKHLKNMTVRNEDFSIFKHLSAPNVITLDVWGGNQDKLEHKSVEPFVKFLLSAPKLKTLIFELYSFQTFFTVKRDVPFKLKVLKVWRGSRTNDHWMNFISFLKQQDTLENVFLQITHPEVVEAVFNHLRNLKKFHVLAHCLPTDKRFYNRLKSLRNLTTYRSHFFQFPNEIAAKGFLGKCPNLENLISPIDTEAFDILPFMAINNPKLRNLQIKTFSTVTQAETKFMFLCELELKEIKSLELMLMFIKNHDTLKKLTVEWVEPNVLTNEVMSKIMTNSNLFVFIFKGLFETMKMIMDDVAHNEKLKKLDLHIWKDMSCPSSRSKGLFQKLEAVNDKVFVDYFYERV